MRILVTGSRDWQDWYVVNRALLGLPKDRDGLGATVVHGGARGADTLAAEAASAFGWRTEVYRADWDRHGSAAGGIRNQLMVNRGADVCLAFVMPCAKAGCRYPEPHDSHGTADCIARAKRAGIPVREYRP
jgi:hypothetical protein